MAPQIESRHLGEIIVLAPEILEDERGFFMETFRADHFKALGLPQDFPQDNHSRSKKGVLRGLHFQWDRPMGKLMRVTLGSAFVAVVDIRKGSPTLGQWFGSTFSAEQKKQIWAPPGFATGFCVLSRFAEVQYKCTAIYNRNGESAIRWDDPDVGINWPISNCILSVKDRQAQTLREWHAKRQSDVFRY